MERRLAFTAGCLLIGSLAALGISRFSGPRDASTARTSEARTSNELPRITQLEAELASLRARVARESSAAPSEMQRQLAKLQDEIDALEKALTASSDADDSQDPAPDDRAEPVDSEAAERERTQHVVAFLEDRLAGEMMDPGGSATVQRDIAQSLTDSALNDTRLGQVQCQSALCRIEADHASRDAERAFVTRLGRLEAFGDAEAFIERFERDDGGVMTTIFISRAGHRLPDPAQAL